MGFVRARRSPRRRSGAPRCAGSRADNGFHGRISSRIDYFVGIYTFNSVFHFILRLHIFRASPCFYCKRKFMLYSDELNLENKRETHSVSLLLLFIIAVFRFRTEIVGIVRVVQRLTGMTLRVLFLLAPQFSFCAYIHSKQFRRRAERRYNHVNRYVEVSNC